MKPQTTLPILYVWKEIMKSGHECASIANYLLS